jgi:hypothetical protein
MRSVKIDGREGEAVMVYSGNGRIVLQVRRLVHGALDPLAPSFKSAVQLDPITASKVAAELLAAAAAMARPPDVERE